MLTVPISKHCINIPVRAFVLILMFTAPIFGIKIVSMMNKYILAAFDMDGTLLDSQKNIRKDSIEAMYEAVSVGKILSLSTGRNPSELAYYRAKLPMMQYIMCLSGALILNNKTDEIIFEKALAQDKVCRLFEIGKDYDAMIHIHSKDTHIQYKDLDNLARCGMGVYRPMFERISVFHDDMAKEFSNHPFPVYKFNFYCSSEMVRTDLEKKIASENLNISMCHAETKSLECSPLGVSKASGLEFLCSYLNISTDEAIAVGDADNDIDILESAGLGIAMGNANANVKAISDAVVADCDSNGIEEVIKMYLMQ